ncbi:MAG TPA: gliding motility-associated C-terminal domain-containing protein [Bacteroidales bacterium]|nr:gliding motility-associated C-terminal domain-containing protein [Bacteroidales bacterium]HPI28932.1 gliding motility-associated C-terminal domain-containing protein [Bacteroidales bacterium]HQN14840.1 gliding motility-associated C-terminal domain-containing protein [Bacteroidales bacterium]HQP14378.1 gliding motility-associated C-terminal domain-containing protein [Bacteroidales bacterium]
MKYCKQLTLHVFGVFLLQFFLYVESQAQHVVNNGAGIVVSDGAHVVICGSFFNLNDGVSDGKLDLDGTVIVKRNWINKANNEVMVSAGSGPVGKVIMDGSVNQYVSGTHSTLFENLVLKNAKKTLDITGCKVNDTLFVDAILDLNSRKIKLLSSNPAALTHISKYIQSETNSLEGLGEVEWYIGQETGSYKLPFGSGFDSTADVSVVLTTTSPGSPAGGSISFATYPVVCQNVPLPAAVDQLDRGHEFVADRYWLAEPFYSDKPEVDLVLQYREQDINPECNSGLKEMEMKAIRYNPDIFSWDDMDPAGTTDADANKCYVGSVSPENFFGSWCLVSDSRNWEIFFPNAFTPNSDGTNDFFSPIGQNLDKLEIKMYIYDRWGGLIYEMNTLDSPWDGKHRLSKKLCPQGIYTWVFFVKDFDGKEYNYKGIVALI